MSIKQDIQRIVSENDGLKLSEIAEQLGRKKSTWLRNHVEALVERGIFERTKERKATGGRPAYIYRLARHEKDSFRREWQRWCENHFALSYVVWLETMLREARNGRD
jgi:predicted ArsR family transcriptional regulator